MTIGERIYELRSSLKLSQKEFAEKIGVAQSSVNYWENGNREPKINQLKKIAENFSIPLDYLIGVPLPSNATIFENGKGGEMISMPINPENLKMALDMDEGMRIIYSNYKKLNTRGKKVAVERISELTNVATYTLPTKELRKAMLSAGIEELNKLLESDSDISSKQKALLKQYIANYLSNNDSPPQQSSTDKPKMDTPTKD